MMIHTELTTQQALARDEVVRCIGEGLNRQRFPRVLDGGLVMPPETDVPTKSRGQENHRVKREGRSEVTSGEGAPGKGPPAGPWSPSSGAPVVRRSCAVEYEEELKKLQRAYPTSRIWIEKAGIWLVAHSRLVEGLDREAVFVVAIPFDLRRMTQGWGFWSRGCLAFAQWIGPRHTNFPLGSICAFDIRDNTWRTGDSPIALLDLYTVWAARHFYLERFGLWPGSQAARWPYERQLECHPDELCGCGSLDKSYADCHLPQDKLRQQLKDALTYLRETQGGNRAPPLEIIEFLRTQTKAPDFGTYT